MARKKVGSIPPIKYQSSFSCPLINQTVVLDLEELIDGKPKKTIWKILKQCNCNYLCNPDKPKEFPIKCPAKLIQKSRDL